MSFPRFIKFSNMRANRMSNIICFHNMVQHTVSHICKSWYSLVVSVMVVHCSRCYVFGEPFHLTVSEFKISNTFRLLLRECVENFLSLMLDSRVLRDQELNKRMKQRSLNLSQFVVGVKVW